TILRGAAPGGAQIGSDWAKRAGFDACKIPERTGGGEPALPALFVGDFPPWRNDTQSGAHKVRFVSKMEVSALTLGIARVIQGGVDRTVPASARLFNFFSNAR